MAGAEEVVKRFFLEKGRAVSLVAGVPAGQVKQLDRLN
jgi:hypothetical protein